MSINPKKALISGVGMREHRRLDFALVDRSYDLIVLLADSESMGHAEEIREKYEPMGKKVIVKEIDSEDYLGILNEALLLLSNECSKHKPEFYVGLGTRFITLAQAALLTKNTVFLVTIKDHEEKIPKDLREIPQMKNFSLTEQQLVVLDVLIENNDRVASITELGRLFMKKMYGIDKDRATSSGSKLAKKLSEKGLVIKKPKEGSKKGYYVEITNLGKTVRAWKRAQRQTR